MPLRLPPPTPASLSVAVVSTEDAWARPAAASRGAVDVARRVLAGQPPVRTSTQGGTPAPRSRLEGLPTELLQGLPSDPRQLQLNRNLAAVLHDPAVSRGFAERPPPVRSEADVAAAIARLEARLPASPQWRDAPLATLVHRLGGVAVEERARAFARIAAAAEACPRPVETLMALDRAVPHLPAADRPAARARIAAHRAGALAQALVRAEDMLDPGTEMAALRDAMASLPNAGQARVLGALAAALRERYDLGTHDFVKLAMAHHDLPWPPAAAAGILRRIGWIPPDAREAMERRARGE